MQLEMEPFDQRADGVSSWGNPSLYGSFSAVQHMYTSRADKTPLHLATLNVREKDAQYAGWGHRN